MPGKGRPFKKGQSGNPKGQPVGSWRDAINIAFGEEDNRFKAKVRVAKALIKEGDKGNIPAIKETA